MKAVKIIAACVLAASLFASCGSTKVVSQAKTPNSVDADATAPASQGK